MPVALVTGGSRGLGLALARALARGGGGGEGERWRLVIDARTEPELEAAAAELSELTDVVAVPGDVSDDEHLRALVAAAESLGGLDLLVNNASALGPSPQPALRDYPIEVLRRVYEVNVFAPLRLLQLALPLLDHSGGRILNITSDAAVEGYEGWGGYGSSKAALEQLTNILAVEHPGLRIYRVDPGDMNTRMHQEAYPGEDISDRPPPEASVPGLLRLVAGDLPSGRYRTADLAPTVGAGAAAAAGAAGGEA
jgi:NAD(P)-dependent dehydrogenase (short-subunit alcohol dehydrogenase family)